MNDTHGCGFPQDKLANIFKHANNLFVAQANCTTIFHLWVLLAMLGKTAIIIG